MKIDLRIIVVIVFFLLSGLNIFLFTKGLILTEAVNHLEKETIRLKLENNHLERELYYQTSLSQLKKKAKIMGFTQKAEPLFLDNLKYAFNQ